MTIYLESDKEPVAAVQVLGVGLTPDWTEAEQVARAPEGSENLLEKTI